MTPQEIFNISATHLLTQNARSRGSYPARDSKTHEIISGALIEGCMYRGENGRKCAIGPLIPDDKYDERMEGRGANHELVQEATGISLEHRRLLDSLQNVHDGFPVEDWRVALVNVAHKFHLNYDVVTNHQPA